MIGVFKAISVTFFYFYLFSLVFNGLIYGYRFVISLAFFCVILSGLKVVHQFKHLRFAPYLDALGRQVHVFFFLVVALGSTVMAILSFSVGVLLSLLPLFFLLGVVCALDCKIGRV